MVGLPLFNELSFIFEFPFARKHTQLHTQENKKKTKQKSKVRVRRLGCQVSGRCDIPNSSYSAKGITENYRV